ncbi:uncharacterized protein EI97DRAFT_435155 [Westerdykella ornata]|uniref:Uncharacterized protein n=1 Tax=Westerdykella ornata TaxID=318751 RepID=A0A6A6JDG2_WESOR|nr:uncharacterized protein EI97DRAFT_435155 [Westerdykella ornata]KAF2274317.1 hypothetical protein EI97DRAFT_435155 [Westerdykella ornata]
MDLHTSPRSCGVIAERCENQTDSGPDRVYQAPEPRPNLATHAAENAALSPPVQFICARHGAKK